MIRKSEHRFPLDWRVPHRRIKQAPDAAKIALPGIGAACG